MMYSNRFIASVRVNGKILRENQGIVSLPFGAEYEILVKNMHSRRAMVKITVDGEDIGSGSRLIIGPNDSTVIERFIKNGNFSSGNKLKFIERTGGIEGHRGIKQEDGLIRCEFWVEKEVPEEITRTIVRDRYVDRYYPHPVYPWTLGDVTYTSGGTQNALGGYMYGGPQGGAQAPGSTFTAQNVNSAMNSARQPNLTSRRSSGPSASTGRGRPIQATAKRAMGGMTGQPRSRPFRSFVEEETRGGAVMDFNDTGITVAGSESHQQFYSAQGFAIETNSHVIVLQLRGEVGGVAVVKPVTVDLKPVCSSCGKKNKPNVKFCADCGTALLLI